MDSQKNKTHCVAPSSETFKLQQLKMFQKYNLHSVRTTSDWDDFPYDEITLKEFWNESTYRVEEGYFLSALSAIRHSEYYYC
jgi:hypothetical protein